MYLFFSDTPCITLDGVQRTVSFLLRSIRSLVGSNVSVRTKGNTYVPYIITYCPQNRNQIPQELITVFRRANGSPEYGRRSNIRLKKNPGKDITPVRISTADLCENCVAGMSTPLTPGHGFCHCQYLL